MSNDIAEIQDFIKIDADKEWTLDYLKSKSYNIAAQVTDGLLPPLETYALVRAISEVCNQLLKLEIFMHPVRDRLDDLNKTERHAFGIDFELRNSSAKWDYSADPEWSDLTDEIKDLLEQRKKIETALQAAYKADRGMITKDGEISDAKHIDCIPGKPTVVCKFKK